MAAKKTNPLELNSKTLTELFKDRYEMSNPSWSVGDVGIKSTTGGRQTVSQERDKYLANIDLKKRTPLQNYLEFGSMGFTGSGEEVGREEQKKAIQRMKQFAGESKAEIPAKEEVQTITVSNPKREAAQKLYRVMYAGKGAENSEVYETKAEADAALKKAGGKGAVAGIDMSRKAKDESKVSNRNYIKGETGDKLSADETEARRQAYIDKMAQGKMDKMVYDEQLARAKSPEYKAALQKRGRLANEAKLAEDKKEGGEFASWRSDVKARRESESQLNFYNNQLGLLKQAYSQARQAGDPITALAINQAISSYTAGVPKEMGARKAAAEKGIIAERNKMLAEKMRVAQEEEAKKSKTAAANPDYNQYNQGNGLMARKPVIF